MRLFPIVLLMLAGVAQAQQCASGVCLVTFSDQHLELGTLEITPQPPATQPTLACEAGACAAPAAVAHRAFRPVRSILYRPVRGVFRGGLFRGRLFRGGCCR